MFKLNIAIKTGILFSSFISSIVLYICLSPTLNPVIGSWDTLTESYGFISIWLIFLSMLAGPLYRIFPNVPLKNIYHASLGGLGISAFYFGMLHSYISFHYVLLGFRGLAYLQSGYIWAIILSSISLFIIALLAGTSFVYFMNILGSRWKIIHQFAYLALILLVLHVFLIGSHFRDFTNPLVWPLIIAFIFLLIIHAILIKCRLSSAYPQIEGWIWSTVVCTVVIGVLYALSAFHEKIIGGHIH